MSRARKISFNLHRLLLVCCISNFISIFIDKNIVWLISLAVTVVVLIGILINGIWIHKEDEKFYNTIRDHITQMIEDLFRPTIVVTPKDKLTKVGREVLKLIEEGHKEIVIKRGE